MIDSIPEAIEAFESLLPPHKCELTLRHNPHRTFYQSVTAYLESVEGGIDDISQSELEQAVRTQELWELCWYPDTPIGSYRYFAASLGSLIQAVKEIFS